MWVLLIGFVGMLLFEWVYESQQWPGADTVLAVCAWIDLGICAVLLSEFALKLALATPRGLYFRRNWITGGPTE